MFHAFQIQFSPIGVIDPYSMKSKLQRCVEMYSFYEFLWAEEAEA